MINNLKSASTELLNLAAPTLACSLASNIISLSYSKAGLFGFEMAMIYRLEHALVDNVLKLKVVKKSDQIPLLKSSMVEQGRKVLEMAIAFWITTTIGVGASLEFYQIVVLTLGTLGTTILVQSVVNPIFLPSLTTGKKSIMTLENKEKIEKKVVEQAKKQDVSEPTENPDQNLNRGIDLNKSQELNIQKELNIQIDNPDQVSEEFKIDKKELESTLEKLDAPKMILPIENLQPVKEVEKTPDLDTLLKLAATHNEEAAKSLIEKSYAWLVDIARNDIKDAKVIFEVGEKKITDVEFAQALLLSHQTSEVFESFSNSMCFLECFINPNFLSQRSLSLDFSIWIDASLFKRLTNQIERCRLDDQKTAENLVLIIAEMLKINPDKKLFEKGAKAYEKLNNMPMNFEYLMKASELST